MKRRRVLITGAGGFVGRALALGFADLGWRVIGLDRAFDPERDDPDLQRVTAELAHGVPHHVSDVELVVHAAWVTSETGTPGRTKADYLALNLRPLLAILEYTARSQASTFVLLSSSGVFAPGDAEDGLTDAHAATGTTPYGASKRAAELLVPAALDPDTAVHIVRLGYLFGPGEVARPSRTKVSLVARLLAAARAGLPLSVRSDDPRRDWTFTPDLAKALEILVDGPPAGGPVHVGSRHVVTDSAVASLIAEHVPGATTVPMPAPGPAKPPMVPSDIPALRDFQWTDLTVGLRALLAEEART